jgi:ABC-2 type transport system permease protein
VNVLGTVEPELESGELDSSMGQPIRGPRALDESWSRFWHLAYNIARSEFKLKFFGSALGYLWQVVRPLMLFGVLYVFFVLVFHVDKAKGAAAHYYGAQLLGSIVLFTCFSEGTSGAVRSVVDRESLVRKIQFPRLAIPISVVLLALFNLALNLVVVLVFAVIEGVRPMLSWLELPLIILMLTVLTTGVAMLLSALFVKFRDISPIWEVVSQILFYSAPVILPAETVRAELGQSSLLYHIYTLNPLVAIFQQFRHAMINR